MYPMHMARIIHEKYRTPPDRLDSTRLTAKLGAHSVSLVTRRMAAARVGALVTNYIYHLRGTMGTAEARPLPRQPEARAF